MAERNVWLGNSLGASWIEFSSVPNVSVHPVLATNELVSVFRRQFDVRSVPAEVVLAVEALGDVSATLNDLPAEPTLPTGGNGAPEIRKSRRFDLGKQVRAGANEIAITVRNSGGPALLRAVLNLGDLKIGTDASWAASCNGSAWAPARVASESRPIRPGSPVYSPDTVARAISDGWIRHALTLVICGMVVVVGLNSFQTKEAAERKTMVRFALGAIAVLWIVLYFHNFRLVSPATYGFDAKSHLGYIDYLQRHHELPRREQGWETHQPPLYYIVAAIFLNVLSLPASSAGGILAVQALSFLFALLQVYLVWASLRVLLPGEMRRPLMGTAAAAFLPATLYHAHYVTNEGLLAVLVTLGFYLVGKVNQSVTKSLSQSAAAPADSVTQSPSDSLPLWSWKKGALIGIVLGAALLTKVSALVIAPIIAGVLVAQFLLSGRRDGAHWAAMAGAVIGGCVLVCGWYYFPHWREIAQPFEARSKFGYGAGWWQEDGFRTASYYLRFGQSLVHPLYSGFSSFWDGLYSTLWGDGLCGGSVSVDGGPPWNYSLMLAGYAISIVPCACLVIGFLVSTWRIIRRPSGHGLLMVAPMVAMLGALIYFSIMAPGVSQVRASFGLILLLPFGALVAVGLDRVASLGRMATVIVLSLFGWWVCNSYSSYSVPRTSAKSYSRDAAVLMREGRFEEAARFAEEALKREPSNSLARSVLMDSWTQLGKKDEAQRLIQESLQRWPKDIMVHLDASFDLAQRNQIGEAIGHARRAVELGPDSPDATKHLTMLLWRVGQTNEAMQACREALRVRPLDGDLRRLVGK